METSKSPLTTLCYIENQDSYLMLHRIKKEKDVNKDKWIGVGGHFEPGESPEQCLLREVKEETGLSLTSYAFRGLVTFSSDDWPTEYMCLFTADGYEGELINCDEGTLQWVPKSGIQQLQLWEGDRIFFRLLEERSSFFSLTLSYEKDVLKTCILDGKPLELLDVLDKDGVPSGLVRERTEVHRRGDYHATVHIWIIRCKEDGRFDVLLQKRSEGKDSFPGCYDISCAGHVSAGQGHLDAAVKELREELGITATKKQLYDAGIHEGRSVAEFYGKPFINNERSIVYLYDQPVCKEGITLQPEEVESLLWMDYETCKEQMETGTIHHCIFMDEFVSLAEWVERMRRERI